MRADKIEFHRSIDAVAAAEWNALGYCNNVVHQVRLTVGSAQPVLH